MGLNVIGVPVVVSPEVPAGTVILVSWDWCPFCRGCCSVVTIVGAMTCRECAGTGRVPRSSARAIRIGG